MKNLFKKLMLVAVAAMAFTACSQDVNEVNKVEKVTRYEFTANFADTRSGFAEKEEGAKVYKSEWYGDETLKLFVTDYNGYNVETTATVDAEGNFTLKLTDAPENFFMTVVSPADSWVSENTANIPAEQTPLANSVDPKAHLLQAQALPVSGGVADINMTHMAAYGKMIVNGVDFAIDHVVVDLKGSFYGYDREYSYTINATNVENNTFWFATEPIDVAEFTVTAYDAEGNAVAKTVNVAEAGKIMSFNYGRVGTFSVKDLEEVEVAPEETVKTFTSANVAVDWDEEKYIVFNCDNGSLKKLQIDLANAFSNGNSIMKEGTYTNKNQTQNGKIFTGTWSGSYYGEGDDMLYLTDITIKVTHVAEGYHIVFENVTEYYLEYTLIEYATYTGPIDGLSTPDVSGDSGDEPVTPSGHGTGTESDPYRLELSDMTSTSWVAYNFTVPGDGNKELHVETNWSKGTQEGSFTFAGTSAPIVSYWSKYDGQTVEDGGSVKFTKNGSNWRIDMCVPAPQGTFYAYYEGPLTR